jgi:hypothetical protein
MSDLIFLGLGFLSASLLGFIAVRIAWRRAVKLTERRMGEETGNGQFMSLAQMEASLRSQSEDIQRLAGNKATLEEAARVSAAEIQSLTEDLNNLHAHYEAARRDADGQRARVAELEAAIMDELHRQEELEPKLKMLGEDVSRMAAQLRRGGPLSAYAPARKLPSRATPSSTQPLHTIESSPAEACQTVETDHASEERPLDERIRALQAGVTVN